MLNRVYLQSTTNPPTGCANCSHSHNVTMAFTMLLNIGAQLISTLSVEDGYCFKIHTKHVFYSASIISFDIKW